MSFERNSFSLERDKNLAQNGFLCLNCCDSRDVFWIGGYENGTGLYWTDCSNGSFIKATTFEWPSYREKKGCIGYRYTDKAYIVDDCKSKKQFICMSKTGTIYMQHTFSLIPPVSMGMTTLTHH